MATRLITVTKTAGSIDFKINVESIRSVQASGTGSIIIMTNNEPVNVTQDPDAVVTLANA